MDLKTWTPFPYLDTEWRIDLPRIVREPSVSASSVFSPAMVRISPSSETSTSSAVIPGSSAVTTSSPSVFATSFGAFRRQVSVPAGVTPDAVQAKFENGVLKVRVELPEEQTSEPQHIPVGTAI